ncbi:MAG: CapA family protein [Anaerolineales bacterium]|nr:CapA family protein [Anaerolineales bacterium]
MRAKINKCLQFLFFFIFFSGCSTFVSLSEEPNLIPTAQIETGIPEAASTVEQSSIRDGKYFLWVDPQLLTYFPEEDWLPTNMQLVESISDANLILTNDFDKKAGEMIFALAAPFPTIPDEISTEQLDILLTMGSLPEMQIPALAMDKATLTALELKWGDLPDGNYRIVDQDVLIETAWREGAWAILPFDALVPELKVIAVNGESPIQKDFLSENFPLTIELGLTSTTTGENVPADVALVIPPNRDPKKMTTVMLTGVTALVRATAFLMHRNGVLYPAEEIGDILRDADILHVNNEIPFSPDCPAPNPDQSGLVFCSDPEYIDLLVDIGTDVIEISGDHFSDWGKEGTLFTTDLYDEYGLPYYGGGRNREDAMKAVLFEHHGNKIALLGCNAKGGGYATADVNYPGAIECDFPAIAAQINGLLAEGYLPIFTFQHQEYYTFAPQDDQIQDFHEVSDAGAVIVSGSQAHQAQGVEFYNDSFIMYGLGNLFFDQLGIYDYSDRGILARHVIYDGHYISTEVIVITFKDYAQPRLATPEEKAELLKLVFADSIWQ